MSDYKTRDFYSPEAVRQVETTNALQAQIEMKYKQLKAALEAREDLQPEVTAMHLAGYKRALDDLTHVAGTTLAHLYGDEKWGKRDGEIDHEDPAYEYGVTGYDDEKPVSISQRYPEALKSQEYWQKNHKVAGNIMRRKRGVAPGDWVKL